MATHKFNPAGVLKQINEIERIFPVNDWEINGLKVWPFLRTALAYSQNQNPNTKRVKSAKPLSKRIVEYLKIILLAPREYYGFLRQVKTSKRLFVGSITHRVKINDAWINKYFDMSIEKFRHNNETSVVLDTGKLFTKKRFFNRDIVFSLWFLYAYLEVRKRLSRRKRTYRVQLPGYDDFHQHLMTTFEHTATLKNNFNKQAVVKRITQLYERTEFLKKTLAHSRLEHAYFLCYYSSLLYPLIGACNKLGIKTTDIQHGGQGPGHYSYDNWSVCPREGYALLPKYFWNWDDNSASIINAWASKSAGHRAVAIGNPWTDVSVRLYNTPPDYTGYVLVNMNEMVAEDFIVETIRHFGQQYKWVLRMHPRTIHNRHVLENQIKDQGIGEFVRIEDSNKIPLTVSLMYCKHFISKPSGSVIEAVEFGLRPVLLRSHIRYYDHFVEENKALRLDEDTSAGLIKYLTETKDQTATGRTPTEKDGEDKFYKFERLIF
jgi:hypothetical protein